MRIVTVVTGASGGIGEELAYCAAKAGRKVVLVARSAEKMRAVADKIVSLGAPSPEIVALDLGDPRPVRRSRMRLRERISRSSN